MLFTLQKDGLLSQAPDEEQAPHEPLADEWQAGYELREWAAEPVEHGLKVLDEQRTVHELQAPSWTQQVDEPP